MLFVNQTELIILIVVCAVAAACFVAAVALLVWTVNNQRRKQKPVRELTEISVGATAAKREFAFGEEFECEGLTVNAEYNLDPTTETLTQYDVLTEQELARLTEAGAANGLCVIKPDTSKAGDNIVIIKYKDKATYYTITVSEPVQETVQESAFEPVQEPVQEEHTQEEPVQEEPVQELVQEEPSQEEPVQEEPEEQSEPEEEVEPAEEEPVYEEPAYEEPMDEEPMDEEPMDEEPMDEEPEQEIFDDEAQEEELEEAEIIVRRREPMVIEEESYRGVLRYDKSFTAKYIQSGDVVKNWYITLKNELLSYKKVKARMSWKRETFRMGRNVVARLGYRGNTLCIYLPLDPAAYAESKYKVEDVSEQVTYADTPCMYRLKNQRRVRYAMELFAAVMENMGGVRIERVSEDYYLPYEGIVELIAQGLVKRVVKGKAEEVRFMQVPVEEEAATLDVAEEAPAEEQAQTSIEEETPSAEEAPAVEETPAVENVSTDDEIPASAEVETYDEPSAPAEVETIEGSPSAVDIAVEEEIPASAEVETSEDNSVVTTEQSDNTSEAVEESEGEKDFSSALSHATIRVNGKNRKRHKAHR